ncbi:MAG: hypothetical protein HPY67_11495 [Syntrophaceae bacterium]|nr:hypothetical protein [Syntrophaceae bacterium]
MHIVFLLLAALCFGFPAAAPAAVGSAVDVSIVTDGGRPLPLYPHAGSQAVKKAYAEAVKGDHYRIVVRNNLNRRVGVVVAVDGRNIISGQQSWLKHTERMYILEPYAVNEYSGWRTAQDRVHRFYFTDAPDSYAAAFGDQSAMGVIAVAVYPEVQRQKRPHDLSAAAPGARPQADAEAKASARVEASPGTGWGREEYSPSRVVRFEPESKAVETVLIKYEWRETLCRAGVIACGQTYGRIPNRLWDDTGYAPPPVRR